MLPALEREHDVLAVTLAGHAGGPSLASAAASAGGERPLHDLLADEIERAMDEAGFATAQIAGNSLGGYLALRLAARDRARSVVALAPAGGWGPGDESFREILALQSSMLEQVKALAPHAVAIASTAEGRRRATRLITESFEHIPDALVAHITRAAAACEGGPTLIEHGLTEGWPLAPERVTCPLRFVWGTADRLLAWPSAAARYRQWFPHAEWIELDGVGHCPQLDTPLETAQLILGLTAA